MGRYIGTMRLYTLIFITMVSVCKSDPWVKDVEDFKPFQFAHGPLRTPVLRQDTSPSKEDLAKQVYLAFYDWDTLRSLGLVKHPEFVGPAGMNYFVKRNTRPDQKKVNKVSLPWNMEMYSPMLRG